MRNEMKSALGGKKSKGFTLIELVVVMAIIAVLALIIIAAIAAARRASVESQNKGNARTLEVALEAHAQKNNGSYCVATGAAGVSMSCPTTFPVSFATLATSLKTAGFLTDDSAFTSAACENGGGNLTDMSGSTFTLRVSNNDCGTTYLTPDIVH